MQQWILTVFGKCLCWNMGNVLSIQFSSYGYVASESTHFCVTPVHLPTNFRWGGLSTYQDMLIRGIFSNKLPNNFNRFTSNLWIQQSDRKLQLRYLPYLQWHCNSIFTQDFKNAIIMLKSVFLLRRFITKMFPENKVFENATTFCKTI